MAIGRWSEVRGADAAPPTIGAAARPAAGPSGRPISASYKWCSKDPVLIFQRAGAWAVSTLDVQVQVPRVGREPHELAMLNVTLPANVAYHMVNMRTPASRLATVFDPSGALVTTDTYGVTLAAAVPGSSEAVRLRVVITNLQGRQSVRCEGAAGQAVRAVVEFAPFGVACQ
jgi:hypothetical protein